MIALKIQSEHWIRLFLFPGVPLVECWLRAALVSYEGALASAWSFGRELLLSVTIPVLRGEAIRLQAGHRHWAKVLSAA